MMMNKNMKKIIAIGIGVVSAATIGIGGMVSARTGKVKIPFSSKGVVGENVDEAKEELAAAGFQNIEVIATTSGWQSEHEVVSVSIDNETEFRKGSYHKPEENVVITYSSDERKDAKTALNGWESMRYKAVYDALVNAGFTNVSTVELDTGEYQMNQRIASVSVNGEEYTKGSCYIPADAPVIISYYKVQLEMGHSSEDYVGKDYKKVISELEEKGFSNIETEKVTTGWQKDNTVISVTIGGMEVFGSSDTFSSDEKIVVTYSSDNRENVTSILKDYQSQMYQQLKIDFNKQGVANLTFEAVETNDKAWNQMVAGISIDGEEFESGECYVEKNADIVVKYYALTVSMPEGESAYVRSYKNNVTALEDELRKLGFTDITLQGSNDLITGWINKEGTVKSISIDGKEKFQAGEKYSYEAPVVIVVNTYKNNRK